MSKKAIVFISGILLAGAICTFAYLETAAAAAQDNGVPEITQTENTDRDEKYIYSGNISTRSRQDCAAGMALKLKEVHVSEGEYVKKGQLLYTLDDSDISAQLSQAQAGINLAQVNVDKAETAISDTSVKAQSALDIAAVQLNDASTNLERVTQLYDEDAISQVQYDQAKTALAAAQAQYNQAQSAFDIASKAAEQNISAAKAQLQQSKASYDVVQSGADKRRVVAEIDGVVADIWARENNTLAIGEKIMDIVDYDSLILEVAVDQFEISAFKVGQEIPVYVNAPGLTVKGTVSEISNQAVVKGEVSSFIVTIDLEQNENLKIGLLAEIKI